MIITISRESLPWRLSGAASAYSSSPRTQTAWDREGRLFKSLGTELGMQHVWLYSGMLWFWINPSHRNYNLRHRSHGVVGKEHRYPCMEALTGISTRGYLPSSIPPSPSLPPFFLSLSSSVLPFPLAEFGFIFAVIACFLHTKPTVYQGHILYTTGWPNESTLTLWPLEAYVYALGEIDFFLLNGKVQSLLIYETFLQEFTSLDMFVNVQALMIFVNRKLKVCSSFRR